MNQETEIIAVLVTVPTIEVAKRISHRLVENRLAACINILPGITSVYRWDDKLAEDQEVQLIIKTRNSLYSELEREILNTHPYEIPEIIAIQIVSGSKSYLDWIISQT